MKCSITIGLLLFGLVCAQTNKSTIQLGNDGEVYNIAGFSTYKKFTTRIDEYILEKIKDSFSFIFHVSYRNTSEFISYVTQDKFITLQLLYAFSNKDIVYSNLLLEVANSFETSQPDKLRKWLADNINFNESEIYNIIKYVAVGKENGLLDLPKTFYEQVLFMNDKYKIFERACTNGDIATINWFIKFGFNLSTVSWQVFEDVWKKGQYDVMEILLENNFLNKVHSCHLYVNKLVMNQGILHVAARFGLLNSVLTLLKYGANVDMLDQYGRTPLFTAMEANRLPIMLFLVNHGADVLVKNKETGDTLLHEAATRNLIDAVSMLLKLGAPVNYKNNKGLTPIYNAVAHNNIQLIYILALNKADINFTTPSLNSLMHVACSVGNIDTVTSLIKLGAAIDKKNSLEETPIFVAAKRNKYSVISSLVNNGADLYTKDRKGFTLLHKAAKLGDLGALSGLIRFGFQVNIRGRNGITALFTAVDEGHVSIIKFLLEEGADPNLATEENWTPLHKAAEWGFDDVVELLINNRANPNVTTTTGITPIDLARKSGHRRSVNIIGSKLYPEFVDLDERILPFQDLIYRGT